MRFSPWSNASPANASMPGISTWRRSSRRPWRGRDHPQRGRPRVRHPGPIIERAVAALRDGDTHYSPVDGRADLRAAIARRHAAATGLDMDADNVIVVAGAQNGLFSAALCLCQAGDEVLVPEPMYLTYEASIRASGAELVPVPVKPRTAST